MELEPPVEPEAETEQQPWVWAPPLEDSREVWTEPQRFPCSYRNCTRLPALYLPCFRISGRWNPLGKSFRSSCRLLGGYQDPRDSDNHYLNLVLAFRYDGLKAPL